MEQILHFLEYPLGLISSFGKTLLGATTQAAKPERTIVVCGVPDGLLNDDIMVDILIIHFQKAKNNGGDVEEVDYPTSTKGVAYITFEDEQVAENVLKKSDHSLEDKRLHGDYPLKVSLYGKSIFTCVTSILDLSLFGEKYNLEDLLQDLKSSLPNLSFGPLQPNGQIRVQGPFLAISTLQINLLLKISEQDVRRKQRVPDFRPNTRRASNGLSTEPRDTTSKEGLIIALDTDTYYYMKKFRDGSYQMTLEKCGVTSYVSVDGEVTTIYLDTDTTKPGPSQLECAKNMIEGLLSDLHGFLRKERLSQEGFNRTEKRNHEHACKIVSSQYPNVLLTPYPTHIDIIGSSSDIYEFTKQVNKMMENFLKEPWR